jgi:hypothetical protein
MPASGRRLKVKVRQDHVPCDVAEAVLGNSVTVLERRIKGVGHFLAPTVGAKNRAGFMQLEIAKL